MPNTILVSGMFRCKFKYRPVLRVPCDSLCVLYVCAQCTMYMLACFFYYFVHSLYCVLLIMFMLLPNAAKRKDIYKSFIWPARKKYIYNKIEHFRMGTIASRVRVWVSVYARMCVQCELNTHKRSQYILSNTFWMSFESLWTIHGPCRMDNWDCP